MFNPVFSELIGPQIKILEYQLATYTVCFWLASIFSTGGSVCAQITDISFYVITHTLSNEKSLPNLCDIRFF